MVFTSLILNMDHGIIPACTWELKKSLQIHDLFLGILGSLVYAGLMIGSLVCGISLSRFNSKKLLIYSLVSIIVSLFIFPLV